MAVSAAASAALRSQVENASGTRAEHTDALVVSNDDSFLIELGPLLGDRYRVHTVDTTASIDARVDVARWIGIVDVDSQADARAAVSRLEVQHPACPLIVVTARAHEWVETIRRGAVLAAIGRDQVASSRLSEALRAAEEQLRTEGIGDLDANGPTARPDQFDVRPLRRGSVWATAVVLLVVLGISAVWLYHRFASPERSGASTAHRVAGGVEVSDAAGDRRRLRANSIFAHAPSFGAGGPTAPGQQNIMELLSAARVALHQQRLLPSPNGGLRGDSALELYVQVLSRDPQNDEALAGMKRLLVLGRNRITTDAADGKVDDASQLLGLFSAAGTDTGDLRPLASAIRAGRVKLLAQRVAQNIAAGDFNTAEQLLAEAMASGADATTIRALRSQEASKQLDVQLAAMARQVSDAVRAGALLQPLRDNARTRLAAMRSIGRTHPLTLQAEHEVQTALVQAGERATRAARFDLAQLDLNAAAELGSFAALSDATRHLQEAENAAKRAPAVALTTVARAPWTATPAAHGRAAEGHALSAMSSPPRSYINAQPTRAPPLTYPAGVDANGSVIVEFTLSAKGLARDVDVVQSDLPEVFNRAAILAVRRGRYSTDELVNGQSARARIKLRFNTPAE